jgi:hypothetical protein
LIDELSSSSAVARSPARVSTAALLTLSESVFSLGTEGDDHRHGPLSIHSTYIAWWGMARFLECLLILSPFMHVGYDFFERVMPIVV